MSATPGAEVVGRYRSDENVPARGAQAYPTSVESCGTHTEHEGPVWVIFLTVFIAHKADFVSWEDPLIETPVAILYLNEQEPRSSSSERLVDGRHKFLCFRPQMGLLCQLPHGLRHR